MLLDTNRHFCPCGLSSPGWVSQSSLSHRSIWLMILVCTLPHSSDRVLSLHNTNANNKKLIVHHVTRVDGLIKGHEFWMPFQCHHLTLHSAWKRSLVAAAEPRRARSISSMASSEQ